MPCSTPYGTQDRKKSYTGAGRQGDVRSRGSSPSDTNPGSLGLTKIETSMEIYNFHARFPGPFERERTVVEIIYYVVRIIYVMVLTVVALWALGGIAA